ncbi:MAG TPA: hypothetical protein VE825_09835 [Terriglobales bacterium]|nr:hypothetical protein [Terriglobales bacterium]
MSEAHDRELLDLVAAHGFYLGLVETALGHKVPVPPEVASARQAPAEGSLDLLQRWLALLDMAITPPMVRDALKDSTSYETAEALLRFYLKRSSEADRDKTDFVTTFLYRKWKTEAGADAAQPIPAFEAALRQVLAGIEVPEPPEEHLRLIGEFEFIRQEVEDFHHFDALMDSGTVQRVRDIKQALQRSFYHPRALATIADYNAFFGQRFDELFRQAAARIKTFAASLQQEGASVMSRVDGDVTVKHLEEVEENESLNLEYGRAQEHFRKISKYKKAVDKRMPGKAGAVAPAPASAAASPAAPAVPTLAATVPLDGLQESKTKNMADFIRNFLAGAPPATKSVIVALPHGNAVITPGEAEAFRAEYSAEKSFRADFANCVVQLVAIQCRMAAEFKEYSAKKASSQYLWKPHADSLAYLLAAANREMGKAAEVMALAQKRGLTDKTHAITATLEKLRNQVREVAIALQT